MIALLAVYCIGAIAGLLAGGMLVSATYARLVRQAYGLGDVPNVAHYLKMKAIKRGLDIKK
jgi:hypothetical protein